MPTGKGSYEHPSFLTQQILSGNAAAATTSTTQIALPYAIRVADVIATVRIAGTTASAAMGLVVSQDGTAKGTISLSTNVAGVAGTLGALSVTVPANGTLTIAKGADATGVIDWFVHYYLDPAATWNY